MKSYSHHKSIFSRVFCTVSEKEGWTYIGSLISSAVIFVVRANKNSDIKSLAWAPTIVAPIIVPSLLVIIFMKPSSLFAAAARKFLAGEVYFDSFNV